MRYTNALAKVIAEEAAENCGYGIENHSGYYELKNKWHMCINKGRDGGKKEWFTVYVVNDNTEEWDWFYTDSLDVKELADLIMEIYSNCERRYVA